ncbi:methyltransferase domain-containing protein [Massilia sp. Se16.2.3]|nr:methyltransferase domain-containing protein [Massilia sp. Se16.2.3]
MGCGTGLCGPVLRPRSRTLTGVDLSERMLARAAETGLYDSLACADLQAYLDSCHGDVDLVMAADVLVYFGDLAALFAQCARRCARVDGSPSRPRSWATQAAVASMRCSPRTATPTRWATWKGWRRKTASWCWKALKKPSAARTDAASSATCWCCARPARWRESVSRIAPRNAVAMLVKTSDPTPGPARVSSWTTTVTPGGVEPALSRAVTQPRRP